MYECKIRKTEKIIRFLKKWMHIYHKNVYKKFLKRAGKIHKNGKNKRFFFSIMKIRRK